MTSICVLSCSAACAFGLVNTQRRWMLAETALRSRRRTAGLHLQAGCGAYIVDGSQLGLAHAMLLRHNTARPDL